MTLAKRAMCAGFSPVKLPMFATLAILVNEQRRIEMQQEASVSGAWRALSNEAASAVEKAARSVVAIHGRRRIPSSGVLWREGIVVTANHALERDDEITVTLPDAGTVAATLAGRDPGTDLAILKTSAAGFAVAERGNTGELKPGHLLLAAGRTAEGSSRASLAMVAVTGPAWRAWTGGTIDLTLRLDRNLHPNLSGGPVLDSAGGVLGIVTPALSRFSATVIPVSTVDRVSAELEKRGHIGRGYLGVGMQPVALPEKLRESLKLSNEVGVMIVTVEPGGPAEKAGVLIGDILVALEGKPLTGTESLAAHLSGEQVGKAVKASLIRGGTLTELAITVAERPVAEGRPFRGRWGRGHGRFHGR
jgi:S1-C subfamily serine protease